MASASSASRPEPEWAALSDEELLKLRICDLGLGIEGSWLEPRVEQLHAELHARKLRIRPRVYLGDEWFSPEGMVAIAVPFYLAHPRLIALERRMMLEVEGDDPAYLAKLLRHEAGHCFDHAYRFSKRRRWREIFGSPEQEYHPETYRPRPYSRSFVQHLNNWYAQAHPDEDFAETFAVWLAPEGDWRKRYADWPIALQKLEYLDELGREVGRKEPGGEGGYLPCSAARLKSTLETYYARRRRENAEDYPDFYDDDLKRIFNGSAALSRREFGAARYMKKHRKEIVDSVSYWTGEPKYTITALVRKLAARCDDLDLRVGRGEAENNLEVAAYLATLVTHYLFTGKFKRRV